jgi:hypothetical protein
MFDLLKRKQKKTTRYVVLATNNELLMHDIALPVVCVDACSVKEMYDILDTMTSVDPTMFLIFEEAI